jgi:hypothetical protein
MIFGQIMMGYYAEMKDPKNSEKTMEELKDMVFKNLAKDPIYYTKHAQFGVKDLGYTDEATALGIPKEAKGKYKSSGYGDLNENIEKFKSDVKSEFEKKPTRKFTDEELKAYLKKKREEELKSREEAGEPLEEIKLRGVIREMIDDELEEAYQLKNINLKATPKEPKGEPQENDKYLYIPDNVMKTLIEKGHVVVDDNGVFVSSLLKSNPSKFLGSSEMTNFLSDSSAYTEKEVLKKNIFKGTKEPYFKIQSSPGIKVASTPTDFEFKTDDRNVDKIVGPVDSKSLFKVIIDFDKWKQMSTKKSIKESVEKDLAAINKEAEHEVLQSKMEKIQSLIDKKQSQLSKLDEDEDMKSLTDDKKVKEISKDIKALEKAKAKLEKLMGKFKGKSKKKEVIDEIEVEASEEYMAAKEDAENRYEEGEEIDSIISNYPNLSFDEREDLRNDLTAKFEGTDNY